MMTYLSLGNHISFSSKGPLTESIVTLLIFGPEHAETQMKHCFWRALIPLPLMRGHTFGERSPPLSITEEKSDWTLLCYLKSRHQFAKVTGTMSNYLWLLFLCRRCQQSEIMVSTTINLLKFTTWMNSGSK